jgi:hypothetical protein
MADPTTPTTAVVPVKSAWASKINWTQSVAAIAMIATLVSGGKLNITADQQVSIVVTIGVFSNVITWILRTWFNGSVNPASLGGNGNG